MAKTGIFRTRVFLPFFFKLNLFRISSDMSKISMNYTGALNQCSNVLLVKMIPSSKVHIIGT